MTGDTFGQAVATFVSLYSIERAARGDTMTHWELLGGLTSVLAQLIGRLPAEVREETVAAVCEVIRERNAARERLN